jgi:hypothetical protein
LFLQHFGLIDAIWWQGQVLTLYLFTTQTRTRMPLADLRMAQPAFLTQNLATNDTMTDVGFAAKTLDAGRIATESADVVEHRSLFQELDIQPQFRMVLRNLQAAVCNLTTVY